MSDGVFATDTTRGNVEPISGEHACTKLVWRGTGHYRADCASSSDVPNSLGDGGVQVTGCDFTGSQGSCYPRANDIERDAGCWFYYGYEGHLLGLRDGYHAASLVRPSRMDWGTLARNNEEERPGATGGRSGFDRSYVDDRRCTSRWAPFFVATSDRFPPD